MSKHRQDRNEYFTHLLHRVGSLAKLLREKAYRRGADHIIEVRKALLLNARA
jgi:hypothetical protein